MKIENLQMTDGESYSILLDDSGMPLPYPNLFMTINHRNNSDASNTCFSTFEHLRYLFEICSFLEIDLVLRVSRGEFLKKTEMESLVVWAKRKVKTFREHAIKQKLSICTLMAPPICG
jgi:hypothetical protein